MQTYIETESASIGDTSVDALRRRLEVIGRSKPELDEALLATIEAARAANVKWSEIAKLTGIGASGRHAQMAFNRARGIAPLGKEDTSEGLSADDAAKVFGVSRPTFVERLKNPESEVAQRTKVITGISRGREVNRYLISE